MEKALLEEYTKTMSKKTDKENKIKEINANFKSGDLFIFERDSSNLGLEASDIINDEKR